MKMQSSIMKRKIISTAVHVVGVEIRVSSKLNELLGNEDDTARPQAFSWNCGITYVNYINDKPWNIVVSTNARLIRVQNYVDDYKKDLYWGEIGDLGIIVFTCFWPAKTVRFVALSSKINTKYLNFLYLHYKIGTLWKIIWSGIKWLSWKKS